MKNLAVNWSLWQWNRLQTWLWIEVCDALHVDHLLKLSSGLNRRVNRFHLKNQRPKLTRFASFSTRFIKVTLNVDIEHRFSTWGTQTARGGTQYIVFYWSCSIWGYANAKRLRIANIRDFNLLRKVLPEELCRTEVRRSSLLWVGNSEKKKFSI